MIFLTDLGCSPKSYSNKATLLLRLCNPYKNFAAIVTNWLIIAKYQFLKCQFILSFFNLDFFLASITDKTFMGLHLVHIQFLVGPMLLIFLVMCVFLFVYIGCVFLFVYIGCVFLFVYIGCVLCTLLSVSLDCPLGLKIY